MLRRGNLGKAAALANRRVPTVGAHDEIRMKFAEPFWAVRTHADHAAIRPNQVADGRSHVKLERRVLTGLVGEHAKNRRLRHKAGDETQLLSREARPSTASLIEIDRRNCCARKLLEPLTEPHLVERIDAAGLQPVAAEGAREVGVPFEERDLESPAGKQVRERRSRRSSAHNDHSPDGHLEPPSARLRPSNATWPR
jgi:hypothetical protein